jgi:hypothetical protein
MHTAELAFGSDSSSPISHPLAHLLEKREPQSCDRNSRNSSDYGRVPLFVGRVFGLDLISSELNFQETNGED